MGEKLVRRLEIDLRGEIYGPYFKFLLGNSNIMYPYMSDIATDLAYVLERLFRAIPEYGVEKFSCEFIAPHFKEMAVIEG